MVQTTAVWRVAPAGGADPGLAAHEAALAVGADQQLRPDGAAVLQRRGHAGASVSIAATSARRQVVDRLKVVQTVRTGRGASSGCRRVWPNGAPPDRSATSRWSKCRWIGKAPSAERHRGRCGMSRIGSACGTSRPSAAALQHQPCAIGDRRGPPVVSRRRCAPGCGARSTTSTGTPAVPSTCRHGEPGEGRRRPPAPRVRRSGSAASSRPPTPPARLRRRRGRERRPPHPAGGDGQALQPPGGRDPAPPPGRHGLGGGWGGGGGALSAAPPVGPAAAAAAGSRRTVRPWSMAQPVQRARKAGSGIGGRSGRSLGRRSSGHHARIGRPEPDVPEPAAFRRTDLIALICGQIEYCAQVLCSATGASRSRIGHPLRNRRNPRDFPVVGRFRHGT